MKMSSRSCKKKTKRKLWGRGVLMPFPPIVLNEVSFTCNPKILWSRGLLNEELLHSLLGFSLKCFCVVASATAVRCVGLSPGPRDY